MSALLTSASTFINNSSFTIERKVYHIITSSGTLCLYFVLLIFIWKNWVIEFLEVINSKVVMVGIFKSIFDNSEEAIIIINEKTVDYINDKLISIFANKIL